ncbi:retrotransposon protein, putative, ty1-copia subclass [Tanacetum coccineum]|uniref:Retrotransposon protein, putative, ty1-copia subclass n=1 Tax=Tanacetum coccineum TaxID=301880 RepID=A0ABQ5FNU2_9ASTR
MGKTIAELYAMLMLTEKWLPKKATTLVVLAIRGGKIQKDTNKPRAAKGSGKGKNKQAYAPKPKMPSPPKKETLTKDSICHHYKEAGHQRRNCSTYWLSYGTHICNTMQGLRGSRKLKHKALNLYVGNGMRAAVEAIGSFDLVLPSGLIIVLDNFHYAPNNEFNFNAILHDGIYEIDMHDLVPNFSFIYTVSNKRSKHTLDSTYLWHCRLGHINKKRIEKLQHDGILRPTNDESFDKCKSCISGKMARKPFPHQTERDKDLLGVIHNDVCGLFRNVSREDLEIIQEENIQPSENTSEHHNDVEHNDVKPHSKIVPIRRSNRIPQAPDRYGFYVDAEENELGDLNETPTYKVALLDPESDKWVEAINAEMQSIKITKSGIWMIFLLMIEPLGANDSSRRRLIWMAKYTPLKLVLWQMAIPKPTV